jgi:hypothetical protein
VTPAPAPSIVKPPVPLNNEGAVEELMEEGTAEEGAGEEGTTEEMPNPKVLEEPAAEADETVPPEAEDEPTTYIRPIKARTSYYRSAKEHPKLKEEPHVAYLLPKPDVETTATPVRAAPVRASVSDDSETLVSLPKPVFPKSRLAR